MPPRADLSVEKHIEELQQIQQFVLLYRRKARKARSRGLRTLEKDLGTTSFGGAVKLDELQITRRR
jgi:hypothetical protein